MADRLDLSKPILPNLASGVVADDTTDAEPLLLYIKAGYDGSSYGACPVCQGTILMLLRKVCTIYVTISECARVAD